MKECVCGLNKCVLILGILFFSLSLRSQNIEKQSFIVAKDLFSTNFNAHERHSSLYLRQSWEWSQLQNTSFKMFGLNLHLPQSKLKMNIGGSLCSEDINIGTRKAVQLSLNKTISFNQGTIVFGLGFGIENKIYYKSRLSKYKVFVDEMSYQINNKIAGIGGIALIKNSFVAVSANCYLGQHIIKKMTGFDCRVGQLIPINEDVLLKVMFIGRNYCFPNVDTKRKAVEYRFGEMIYNLSTYCLLSNNMSVGAEIRFDHDWGMVVKRKIYGDLELGYEFNLQFDYAFNRIKSHSFTLNYYY
jgi:hypothetical protein